MDDSNFSFPEELIIEILLRLPAGSLVEFKLVCKAWNLLIKTPKFISMHLKQSQKNPNLSSMLLFSRPDYHNVCSMLTYSENSLNIPMSPHFPFMAETDDICIVGVSDGLICIMWCGTAGLKFLICNPVTKKFHKIPDLELLDNPDLRFLDKDFVDIIYTSFGFGFDANINDKLIIVMPYVQQDEVAIYSMSTNSWRIIDTKFPDDVFIWEVISLGTIGDVFYWSGIKHKDNNDVDFVLWSFDMRDEVHRVIEGPNCYEGKWDDLSMEFTRLNEELAMFVSISERCYNVWVLNKEGTCWSEKFRIDPFPIIERPVPVQHIGEISVVGCSENGGVIVIDKTVRDDIKLCTYNLTSKEFKVLPFPHRKNYVEKVFWYTETLLPVKKNDQVQ